jgi:hypothetical protein
MRHELYLVRMGFRALLPLAFLCVLAAWALAGGRGAASAAIGAALVGANHLVAALSTAWSRTITPKVIGITYAVFVVRMAFVLGLFGTLSTVPWVHPAALATSFCAALVVTLGAEVFSYSRGSYVPSWMRRQAPRADWRTR